ncbi:MAG TPA: CARDB domain-containing protein [Isosphaeraceae bacterium]|nr:CARDB domain-containing protein [Isosphaeraceae bacterium]
MPSHDRRAVGRRRAWGRGPIILKLESLERRALLSANSTLPDLVNSALVTSTNVADWGDTLEVQGRVTNQGGGTTDAPFQIALYASPVRGIDKFSVPIGSVTIPAGLAAGQSVPYQATVTLPATPVPDVSSTNGTLYVAADVNPGRSVTESNYHNDKDVGPPYDVAPVVIQPPVPAKLVGTTLAVTPTDPTWGSTITVTAQITNESSGSAPQSRALLTLTPQGLTYGGTTTIGIGSITVPPLGPYQVANLEQTVTLPAVAPLTVANYTNFGLAMTQDADYVTNALYPHQPDQGVGYDQTPITITVNPDSTATTGPLPDLATSSVLGPTSTVRWGQSIAVTTEIQNLGQGAAGPFMVRFLLTGQGGSINDALFLGDVTIPGLAAGANQQLTQTLQLPTRLPAGLTLNSVGYARIAVIADPENFINETLKSNNESISAPFIVRLPGNATTVPTTAAPGTLPTVAQVAEQSKNIDKHAAAVHRAARIAALAGQVPKRKLRRHAPPRTNSLVHAGIGLATELTKLPHQVVSVIKKSV